jgi:hypothetical protein
LPDFSSSDFEIRVLKDRAGLEQELSVLIGDLIVSDFNRLVQILYRLDIDERRLKSLIKEHPDADSAKIIASMIIERQVQKIHSRKQNPASDDIPDDEKW